MTFRRLHRAVAIAALLPLTVSAVTGVTYRVGRNWFEMSDQAGAMVRAVHEGKYLGEFLSAVYVLLVGAALLLLICSGLTMMRGRRRRSPRRNMRWFHRTAAIVFVLPLALTPLTGIAFRLTQSWLGWSKQRAQWLLDLHQGTYFFGKDYRLYYVLFASAGLLVLLTSGATMLRIFKRLPPRRMDERLIGPATATSEGQS